jgi:hypothetical protein
MASRIINICWFWFKWGLIACAIAAALLVPYFYHRMDEGIRCRVEELFAKAYPELQVKVRSAALMKGEGISLRGVSIVDPAAEGPCAELLTYDECLLVCPTDLSDLIGGEPRPTRVVLRRPTLRMTRRSDGSWSASRLLPLPRLSNGAQPEICVENGTIEIFDPTKTPACSFTLRDVNLSFTPISPPDGSEGDSPIFAAPRSETGHPADAAKIGTVPPTRRRRIQGTATGDYFRQVIFDGEIDIDRPAVQIAGKIDGMEISPEMRNMLPDVQGCNLSLLGSLRGETEAHFQVSYDPAVQQRWNFDVTGQLAHGRIDDPRLPHPLTEIQATVHVDNAGFSIRDLKARSNQATLALACSGGLTASAPLDLEGDVRQLPLDGQLLGILPPKVQEHWQDLQPEGVIDANIQLHYDGRVWQPRVRVQCKNVSFAHVDFPYRLDHGEGLLELKDDRLTLELRTSSENQPVYLAGEVRSLFAGATVRLRARCDALPLDEKLQRAMPREAQDLVQSLDLRGKVAVELELSKDEAHGPLHKHLWARPDRCALRYKGFPFAISNINGQLEMYDGNWWFRNLDGCNGTSRVAGEGTFTKSPKGNELVLQLSAGNVPLEGELREALPDGMRQVWALLQPHGIIDLKSTVHYLSGSDLLDVTVRAEPRSETCSLEPVQFPYRLDNVQGVFSYGNGKVTFERFSAWHGAVKLACNGACSFRPDGAWQLKLDRVAVDRLRLDRQFMQILPQQLRKNLGELNATGPISLHGGVVVARSANQAAPTLSQWNFSLGLNQVGVDCGVRLENIWGNVRVNGWSDGTRYQMRGELDLESMTCHDIQLTQVLGPFWIDEQQAMFGSSVAKLDNQSLPRGQQPAAPRPVVAKIFGGMVYGDGWTSLGDQSRFSTAALGQQPRYIVQARLVDADLAACDRELAGKNRNLHGRVEADIEVHGSGHTRATLGGQGGVHLHHANIYELPAMVSLLKILSIKAPDPNAFSTSDAKFRIEGEHVYFDKLDFNGDAVSLSGKGEMNFQGDTRMVFTATLGRGDAGIPVLRDLFTGVAQQILQIRVTGNVQDPKIVKEAFPGVNQALKNQP